MRAAIAGRYLGVADGERVAAERRSRPGVLIQLVPDVRGSGICRASCHLIDPEQHRTTPRARVACGLGQLRVLALPSDCASNAPLIIQTILLYLSGAVWTDEPFNVSRLDPSGAD
jgi:hypothetical protein